MGNFMKKKIKDLTDKERKTVCRKYAPCSNCPLSVIDFTGDGMCIKRLLESEVEVDE